jgi:hypothetical protein
MKKILLFLALSFISFYSKADVIEEYARCTSSLAYLSTMTSPEQDTLKKKYRDMGAKMYSRPPYKNSDESYKFQKIYGKYLLEYTESDDNPEVTKKQANAELSKCGKFLK